MADHGPVRVLVVDDSAVARMAISQAFKGVASVEATTVASGAAGLKAIEARIPDVVVLDVEMPEMDGLATLERLRASWPDLPVVMFSSVTHRGATATLESLFRGANDWVTKPSSSASAFEMHTQIREQLLPRITGLARRERESIPVTSAPRPLTPAGSIDAVAIGASAGGPIALAAVLRDLPRDLNAAVLVSQHMPPIFTRVLAERLDAISPLRVEEGANGVAVYPGRVYLAPGGFHMAVTGTGGRMSLRVHQEPPVHSCRPSVDILFESVAATYGVHAAGVVLTGMGVDGLAGCTRMKAAGSRILVQDQASSAVWGMPGAVARANLADAILPVNRIGGALEHLIAAGAGAAMERG